MKDPVVIPGPIARVEGGRFAPGQSACPGGKQPGMAAVRAAIRDAALTHSTEAITELRDIMVSWREDPKMAGASVKAAEVLLAYGVGKPAIVVDAGDTAKTLLEKLATALTEPE